MTDIIVINNSALLGESEILAVVSAINEQIVQDFAPFWGVSGTLYFGSAPSGAWKFSLQDSIDNAQALGYHVDQNGVISAIIDVKACKESGSDWRTCLGHEVLEALADPLCNRIAPDGITSIEVADPVEEDSYEISGIPVTNFVTPAYYGFNSDTRYDHLEYLKSPAPALRPGGYISRLTDGQWISTFGEHCGFMATRTNGRRAWRQNQA